MNVPTGWHRLRSHLTTEVDGALLGSFRILVALEVIWVLFQFAWNDGITEEILGPHHLFKYPLFHFVAAPTGLVPYLFFPALAGVAVGVLVGWRTRWTTALLATGLTYWFLIDASVYSDERYLLCLLAAMLSVLPVHRWLSSDRFMNREQHQYVPLWTVWLLRAQFLILITFSALGQCTGDWLAAAPLGEWISLDVGCPVARWFAARPGLFPVLAWGNMLFELAVGPLLCWKRSRRAALILFSIYSVADGFWFRIGGAPYLYWSLSLMFCRPDAPRQWVEQIQRLLAALPLAPLLARILCRLGQFVDNIFNWFDDTPVLGKAAGATTTERSTEAAPGPRSWQLNDKVLFTCCLWLSLQILIPARAFLSSDHPAWTELTTRFSWRGRLWEKESAIDIYAIQSSQSLSWPIEPTDEFPVPLAILFREEELERRQISEGSLRDLARGTDVTLPMRIAGLGLSTAEANYVLRSSEQFDMLQLSEAQAIRMGQQPELLRQYARHVARILNDVLGEDVTVHAENQSSLNHRPFSICLSDEVVLSDLPAAIDLSSKLRALKEPLPPLGERLAVARERAEEQQRLRDLDVPSSSGRGRGGEPAQVPPFTDDDEALIRNMFP